MKIIKYLNTKKFKNIKEKLIFFIKNKIDKRQKLCILAGIFLSVLSILFNESIFIKDTSIKRNSYGGQNTEYSLRVKGIGNDEEEIKFTVSSRRYTAKEADEKFNELFLKLPELILEDNLSFDEIRSNLKLIGYFNEEGIYADYLFKLDSTYKDEIYEKYRNVFLLDGKINNEILDESDEIKGTLKIIFSCFTKDNNNIRYQSNPYIIPITIKPKILNQNEILLSSLIRQISTADIDTITSPILSLPKQINNTDIKISYKEKQNFTFLIILALSIIITILLPLNDKSKKNDKKKKRLKILQNEYYSFVTKIAIYFGAGETIKNALIRINTLSKYSTNKIESPLSKELEISIRKMDNGISEDIALSDLSNRIGLRQYTKLFNILEQNRKNGSNDVRIALNNELSDAFKERKLNAKILGEEAQTKLIFPLIMMLGIVLVIIMVPAITGI